MQGYIREKNMKNKKNYVNEVYTILKYNEITVQIRIFLICLKKEQLHFRFHCDRSYINF